MDLLNKLGASINDLLRGGEESMKNGKSSYIAVFGIFAMLLLLSTSFCAVYANSTTNNVTLPKWVKDFIKASLPNATVAEINQIENHWLNQLILKQKCIASTNGAVLNKPLVATDTGSYMSQHLWDEQFGGGTVYQDTNIVGLIDYAYTRFYTPDWSQGNDGGASVIGQLSSASSSGQVYVVSKLGPTGAGQNGNYVIVYGSNNPYGESQSEWLANEIGYAQVTTPNDYTNAPYVFVGTTSNTYSYVCVGCVTMGGSCTYNDVLADCVWFTSG